MSSFIAYPRIVTLGTSGPVSVSENTRICSVHFEGGDKSENSPVPTLFPWSKPVKCRRPPAVRESLPLKRPKQAESACASQPIDEIARHEKKIIELQSNVLRLEEEVKTLQSERFLLQRFQGSDKDIQFYTGLPSYSTFMCLLCYLCLCRNEVKNTSTRLFKPRARALLTTYR